jgi:putative hydrolase
MALGDSAYDIKTDMHMHTIASDHAFCTVLEMAKYASEHGVKAIAITDHGPALPDGAHLYHFNGMSKIPEYLYGVRVYRGAEANILDYSGSIDLRPKNLRELDWIIASFHGVVCQPGTVENHSNAYLKLAENPFVDVIGHSGMDIYKYDYERVIPVLRDNKKLIEINSHSFSARQGAAKNCRRIAEVCKKCGAPIVVNSDAHICFSICELGDAISMLKDIEFPPELIMNLTAERIDDWITMRKSEKAAVR